MNPGDIRHLILGTAGHIDHGKSSLVKALTGTDPDRLPEEKARGMTIDLGFARLELPQPAGHGAAFAFGIVDVPGHADFVNNMVAGVGGIDIALLTVAADDSWMPQTEEHVQILGHLGVKQAVVALTKADLVDDCALAELDVREHLAATPFADAPIIPVSVVTGHGLDQLRDTLTEIAAVTAPPRDTGKPRLAIDRVFSVKGIGTVVTGTLTGGCFTKGQAVRLMPVGLESRARSLQSHGAELDQATPGSRVALNLQGLPIASREQKNGVKRGDVVTLPGTGEASHTLHVKIDRWAHRPGAPARGARPLRHGARVRFHHGSGSAVARVFFLDPNRKELASGESALAQLRFEQAVFVFTGDHFVLRGSAMDATLGGGTVLETDAVRRQFRAKAKRECLEALAAAADDLCARLAALLARDKALQPADCLKNSTCSQAAVDAATAALVRSGKAINLGPWLVDAGWWLAVRKRAGAIVDEHHRSQPLETHLPLAKLESSARALLGNTALFEMLVKALVAGDYEAAGDGLRRRGHQVVVPESLAAAAERIRQQLAARPLDPPGLKEVLTQAGDEKALRLLVDQGEALRLDASTAVTAAAYRDFTAQVSRFLATHGPASASEIRQATGTTRRVLIPLLEKLDADRVTVRRGDTRCLRQTTG